MLNIKRILIGTLALALLGWPATPHAAAQTGTKTYEVTITNITNSKQGLSPLVIATHPAGVHAWQMGQLASKGTELLAEEGMPGMLAAELKGSATDVVTTNAHLLPGDSITVHITANAGDMISAASMLIQTNDGFTGLDSVPITEGDQDMMAYDAGTEDNSEKATDVPGPPFGGKNSGPDSAPHQPISMHPGISGQADVTPDFKWSGPVARFSIHAVDMSAMPSGPAYDVTITNINNSKQGLSPLFVATHPASAHAWQMGQLASKGLELLAEEGMPGMLAAELKANATDVVTTNAHLLPGDSITVRVLAHAGDVLSAGSMLIQTNDGFTGLDSVPITDGERDTMAYDAGTEVNTELAADVPGPPFGGKMHGPDPTPHEAISMHPGISGKADVTPDFNWSGPVARFTIRAASTSVMPAPAPPTTAPPMAPTPTPPASSMPGMPVTGQGDPTSDPLLIGLSSLALGLLALGGYLRTRRRQLG